VTSDEIFGRTCHRVSEDSGEGGTRFTLGASFWTLGTAISFSYEVGKGATEHTSTMY
jgi:hypothetical protein